MVNHKWFPNADRAERTPGKFEDGMDYFQCLFHYAYTSRTDEVHVVENRMLHRLNIFHLQNELAKLKGSIWTDMNASEDNLIKLRELLHEHGRSI
jgi:hypothetical protein